VQRRDALLPYADELAVETAVSGADRTGMDSTGSPRACQASNPPSKGQTSLYPLSFKSRAILALVASLGQVQYITTGRPEEISLCRSGNSCGGMRMAPGIFAPEVW
jgi:hypothetical protein